MISTKSYPPLVPPPALHLRTTFWMFRKPYAAANRSTVSPFTSRRTSRKSGFLARGVVNGSGPVTDTPKSARAARRNV